MNSSCHAATPLQSVSFENVEPKKPPRKLVSELWRWARKLAQALARVSEDGSEIHSRIERAKEETFRKNFPYIRSI